MWRFSDAVRETLRARQRPASEKRQGTKSRWVGHPAVRQALSTGAPEPWPGSIGLLSLNHWQNRSASATLIRSNSCADALRRWKSEAPALSLKTAAGHLARRLSFSLRLFHIFRRAPHDIGRGCIDLGDEGVGRSARHRPHVEALSIGVGKELRVLHGGVERLAQRGQALRRNAGRRHEGACHRLAGDDEFQNGLLLRAAGDIEDRRHLGKLRNALVGKLEHHADLLRLPQVPVARRQGGPRPAAARSEEHTSELQSQSNLVCRLLLEKKKKKLLRLLSRK